MVYTDCMSTCTECGRSPRVGRGLCTSCYYKHRRDGTLPPMIAGGYRQSLSKPNCKVPGCSSIHEALGYCAKHYMRFRNGNALEDEPQRSLPDTDRFWAQTNRAVDGSNCLLWTSTIRDTGYGQVWWEGKTEIAHRVAYLLAIGPIPPKYQIDHVQDIGCCHTECVEPQHLEAITHAENQRRKRFSAEQRAKCAEGGRKGSESRWRGITDPAERFWTNGKRAEDGSNCLLWTLHVHKAGYGQVNWYGSTRLVHRVAWELANGKPVPEGYDVDHVRDRGCRYRHCIEPEHLEAVPMKINRGRRAHPAVLRELPPERFGGPGRRRNSTAIQGGITKADPVLIDTWKRLLAAGWSQAKVGREYGVSQMTVSRATRNSR